MSAIDKIRADAIRDARAAVCLAMCDATLYRFDREEQMLNDLIRHLREAYKALYHPAPDGTDKFLDAITGNWSGEETQCQSNTNTP